MELIRLESVNLVVNEEGMTISIDDYNNANGDVDWSFESMNVFILV